MSPDKVNSFLKDWKWLIGGAIAAIVVWGNLPQRVAAVEQNVEDLKGWAKEIQGYTRAQQEQSNNYSNQNYQPQIFYERDSQGDWVCQAYSSDECDRNNLWRRPVQ